MGLTKDEIAENHALRKKYPDLRIPLYMELDTDGKVRLNRTSIQRDDIGVRFSLIIEDGFDYEGYQKELKEETKWNSEQQE